MNAAVQGSLAIVPDEIFKTIAFKKVKTMIEKIEILFFFWADNRRTQV